MVTPRAPTLAALLQQWPLPVCLAAGLLLAGPAPASTAPSENFIDLSLEELNDYRITSVSRREQRLGDTAAAAYVITAEAIQRAGATSLPEALRLAPNLLVARINAYQYAISARGFNGSTANKLLVMIDGRTVYTPLYSGVFWDAQDVLLAEVDRIEVISGPGGTIWGTNAVNGIINIVTRRAGASGGDLLEAGGGASGSTLAMRHGGGDDDGAWRLYAKTAHWRPSARADGSLEPDGWNQDQAGFRADWRGAGGETSVMGDLYQGSANQRVPGRQHRSGANLLARWDSPAGDAGHWSVQGYLDRTSRTIPGTFGEELNTADLEAHYSSAGGEAGQTIAGGGYRLAADRVSNTLLAFLPARRTLHWSNLFAQHERELAPGWRLTAGLRLEHNDYTGLETLPSAKLAWQWQPGQLGWLGLARSVRAPSRIDRDFYFPAKPPFVLAGGPQFSAEVARSVELGWRGQAGSMLNYTVVLHRSQYQRLRSLDPQPGGVFVLGNKIHGRSQGLDSWATLQLRSDWSLELQALLLDEHFDGANLAGSPPGNDPHAQTSLRSRWTLDGGRTLDLAVRHVSRLPSPAVPAYTVLDLNLGWQLTRQLQLVLGARNLLNRRHQEFPFGTATNPIQGERALDLLLSARF
jgi:iron complex outermembrane receptor protein